MNDQTSLLSCPFCEGPAEMKHLGEHFGASCSDWKCQGMQGALMHRDEKSAIEAWNRRNIEQNVTPEEFQMRVRPWMLACFGVEIAADRIERNHRFFEEAAELVQACGMTASEAHQLVDYTWSRPVGEKSQEVGGVMVTLAALCLANGLDMHSAGETELARINRPDMVIRIRAKQASKPKHSPLPEAPDTAGPGPYDFEVLLGEQMYIDSSMQYRNGTVNLTIKRKPRETAEQSK